MAPHVFRHDQIISSASFPAFATLFVDTSVCQRSDITQTSGLNISNLFSS
jgi:hypothetical protein